MGAGGRAGVLVLVGIFFMIIPAVGFMAVQSAEEYQDMRTSSVSEILPGDKVKLYGTITSAPNENSAVIWYETHTYRSGRHTRTKTTYHSQDTFELSDATGKVTIKMNAGSVYFASKREYVVGDKISVVGKVSDSTNSVVYAEAVAESPSSFSPPSFISGFLLTFMFIGLALIGLAVYVLIRSRKMGTQPVSQVQPVQYSPTLQPQQVQPVQPQQPGYYTPPGTQPPPPQQYQPPGYYRPPGT